MNLLRKTAYYLAFTMLVESVIINLDTKVFSKESMSLESIKECKERAIDWLKNSQNNDGSIGDKLNIFVIIQPFSNFSIFLLQKNMNIKLLEVKEKGHYLECPF